MLHALPWRLHSCSLQQAGYPAGAGTALRGVPARQVQTICPLRPAAALKSLLKAGHQHSPPLTGSVTTDSHKQPKLPRSEEYASPLREPQPGFGIVDEASCITSGVTIHAFSSDVICRHSGPCITVFHHHPDSVGKRRHQEDTGKINPQGSVPGLNPKVPAVTRIT